MALASNLFRHDRKLQAASVSDPDHILYGCAGPHVQKVQLALNLIDHAVIDRMELDRLFYGRSTAKAVLAYKQKRNIINRSYQTQVDDIVGKMTLASLDREMVARELLAHPACNCGPSAEHLILAFSASNFSPAPAPPVTPPPPPPPPAQMFVVQKALPFAIDLVQSSLRILEAVAGGSMQPPDDATLASKALQTHYLCTAAELGATAQQVKAQLNDVLGVLKKGTGSFAPGIPGDPDGGKAYAYSRSVRDGNIYINPEFLLLAEFGRRLILVHEAFHSLAADIVDFCRNPDNDAGASYRTVPKTARFKNAYCLSQFVLHLHLKAEKTLDVETDEPADLAP